MMAMGVPDLWSRGTSATLLVLNYHRVWPRGQRTTDFDEGVFDVDVDTFRRQMEWLRSATEVLDEAGLLEIGAGARRPPGAMLSAVTFDDGYVDCFTQVRPVLDRLGMRGIFFIPVEILNSRRLGWWDVAAYLLKQSKQRRVTIRGQVFDLGDRLSQSLARILALFKLEPAERTAGLLAEISDACGVEPPSAERQSAELMNWDQVRQLRKAGHAIGSHAWSHRPLATLTPDAQSGEIHESRAELQRVLGGSIDSFAYPVGGPRHFNETSARLVREAGYRQAFSFNTGICTLPITDRFRIARESAKSFEMLKAKALLPGFMGLRSKSAA
jgi:peptidoglycan/xylan/chitin deacetylase (PgdA/CDA1 family)